MLAQRAGVQASRHRGGWRLRRALPICRFVLRVAFASTAVAGAAEPPSRVEVVRSGQGVLEIHAQARIGADPAVVWAALTDYENFPRFIAGLRRSVVLSRATGSCTVEQQWRIPLLWFSIPVDVTVNSIERPPSDIEVRLVRGNLKQLEGRYRIERLPDGAMILRWDGIIEGFNLLPDWIVTPIVRKMALAQFEGMLAEISRRDSARSTERSRTRTPAGG
jgi:ribosome-associated toxin RatA of RatAB toxin-antitoxin module